MLLQWRLDFDRMKKVMARIVLLKERSAFHSSLSISGIGELPHCCCNGNLPFDVMSPLSAGILLLQAHRDMAYF